MKLTVGTYAGNGAARDITTTGINPSCVWVTRSDFDATVMKTTAMGSTNSKELTNSNAFMTDAIVALGTALFSLGTNTKVNASGGTYFYVAIEDNSASDFKTFSYVGDGIDDRTIGGVGFQPDLIWIVKDSGEGVWRSASHSGDSTSFQQQNTGTFTNNIQAITSDGFQLGSDANVNQNGVTYYVVCWKYTSNIVSLTQYTGTGADDLVVTGAGFQPELAVITHRSGAAARNSVCKYKDNSGEASQHWGGSAIATDGIQSFGADGVTVGTNAHVNENTHTYFVTFFRAGISVGSPPATGGSKLGLLGVGGPGSSVADFSFAQGSYAGSGVAQSIAVGFQPDIVWVKGSNGANAVFAFSNMAADYSREVFGTSASFTGGITAFGANGFSVGTDTRVNAAATTYYWQAWKAAGGTLALVSYTGNGVDDRTITVPGLGTATPDLVWLVGDPPGLATPFYCTDLHNVGDSQPWENGTATNCIQALSAGGFQVGTNNVVNQNTAIYWAACFVKIPGKFNILTYNGDGIDNRSITGAGFQPEFAIVQRRDSTGNVAQFRSASLGGDSTLQTTGGANTNRIQALEADGVQLGTRGEVNGSAFPYTLLVFKA